MDECEESERVIEIYGDGSIVEPKDYSFKSEYSFLDKMIYKGILRRAKRDGYTEEDMISISKTWLLRACEKNKIDEKRQIGRWLTVFTFPESIMSFADSFKRVDSNPGYSYLAYPPLLLYAVLLPITVFGILSARKKYLDYWEEFVEDGEYTGLAIQRLNKKRRCRIMNDKKSDSEIRDEYQEMYAHTILTRDEVYDKLKEKYPDRNMKKILMPVHPIRD